MMKVKKNGTIVVLVIIVRNAVLVTIVVMQNGDDTVVVTPIIGLDHVIYIELVSNTVFFLHLYDASSIGLVDLKTFT